MMMTSDRARTRPTSSRLSESLTRLQRTVQSAQLRGTDAQAQFDAWRARWEGCQDQIVQRLSLIDDQLQELVQQPGRGPQLALHRGESNQ